MQDAFTVQIGHIKCLLEIKLALWHKIFNVVQIYKVCLANQYYSMNVVKL